MPAFDLRLLGGVELVDAEGRSVEALVRQPKRVMLLAHLALCPTDFFLRRDAIMGLFWPELDTERARHSLRQSLYFIRRHLGEGVIEARGAEEIRIDRARLRCDVWAFEAALAADRLKEAQGLYRGDLADGLFASEVSEQLEQLFEARRQRLRERTASAAWELAERAAADSDPLEVHHWGRRAVELSPEVESAYRRLIKLLDWIGDGAAAVEVHRTLEARLESELGVEPSPETTQLIEHVQRRRIRRGASRSAHAAIAARSRAPAPFPPPRDDGATASSSATAVVAAGLDRSAILAGILLVEIAILALALLLA
jgi:DNA-binding SARP family transcriptional activator